VSYVEVVPQLDLIDETFVVACPGTVAALLHDPGRWRQWWPDLRLSVSQDRAEQGIRWQVTGVLAGSVLAGSMEVWLEQFADGVIVHYYLRADPPGGPLASPRQAVRAVRRLQRHAKRVFWLVKDELEGARRPGVPRG
jgi:hypothetical protein